MKTEPTVFIVDDDPAVLKSMRWLIESAHFRAQTYSSGAAFLQEYDVTIPGCLLLDVRMPDMTGLDVQSQLLERGATLPVIIMTGHGDVPTCTRSFKQGAFDFIEKPANDELLLQRIDQAIATDAGRRQMDSERPEIEARLAKLTARETEVMGLIVDGKSLKQIAIGLQISIQTAAKHRAKILDKLVAANDVEIVRLVLSLPAPRS